MLSTEYLKETLSRSSSASGPAPPTPPPPSSSSTKAITLHTTMQHTKTTMKMFVYGWMDRWLFAWLAGRGRFWAAIMVEMEYTKTSTATTTTTTLVNLSPNKELKLARSTKRHQRGDDDDCAVALIMISWFLISKFITFVKEQQNNPQHSHTFVKNMIGRRYI
ncbi:hypothetical protein FF38_11913 [Lucilia cuprina]|uniref:Uncharacterized protein n=1 Tax=Lucilia cuprina TaxID=7375 RepID=A0A0L0BYA4_LUCCU|nr:hypothetical protein FF38_11913 [Lucilia cuprina]